MNYYHGAGQKGPYFEGWYLKHQGKDGALALIPAIHIDRRGRRSSSLQIITRERSWWLEYPCEEFCASESQLEIQMGRSRFCAQGMQLDIEREGLSLHGAVRYGPLSPLRSNIMGPFRFLKMECSHGVLSMRHDLEGTLLLNGRTMSFSGGTGYIETDRGRSFPGAYLWTQCTWDEGSLMLSIATIPLPVGSFTGCICAALSGGREYRLASYLGARVRAWSGFGAAVEQGKYRLTVERLQEPGQPLRAPVQGGMHRVIRENLCTKVRYRLWHGQELLFDRQGAHGSFEYAKGGANEQSSD